MPFGTPFNCIMAIIDQSNAAMPFVIAAYPALLTAFANQHDCVAKCQVLIQHQLTYYMDFMSLWECAMLMNLSEYTCIIC